MSYQENRIFTLNEPNAPRLNPALAVEIGLNESLLLLQIEFFIAVSGIERDGQKWIYNSTRDIQTKWFPFWSPNTINRGIKSLESSGYIISTTQYNKVKYDKTRWFALNFNGLSNLKSIVVKASNNGHGTGSSQFDTGSSQNGTTIQETKKEIQKETMTTGPATPQKERVFVVVAPSASVFKNLPDAYQKPSVAAVIDRHLKNYSQEEIDGAVRHTLKKITKKTLVSFRSYLDKLLTAGYDYEAPIPDNAEAARAEQSRVKQARAEHEAKKQGKHAEIDKALSNVSLTGLDVYIMSQELNSFEMKRFKQGKTSALRRRFVVEFTGENAL